MEGFLHAEAVGLHPERPGQGGVCPLRTTNWAEVAAAAGQDMDRRLEALPRLLPRYLPALKRRLANRFGLAPEALEDAL